MISLLLFTSLLQFTSFVDMANGGCMVCVASTTAYYVNFTVWFILFQIAGIIFVIFNYKRTI